MKKPAVVAVLHFKLDGQLEWSKVTLTGYKILARWLVAYAVPVRAMIIRWNWS